MNSNISPWILFILAIAILVVGLMFFRKPENTTPVILSFEDCMNAGYPVMESYPRKCRTPLGVTYTEKINDGLTYMNAGTDLIKIESPLPGAIVSKNFNVTGQARGTWFFEASFPITLLDSTGNILSQNIAQAQNDWMTENFVPFKAEISVPNSYTGPGTLILHKDNPSGLAQHDASVSFNIIIEQQPQMMSIKLYYYNPSLDQGPGGVQCSKKGLVSVDRTIPDTLTPLTEAIKLLLLGNISMEEKADGVQSEFPLPGVTLTKASIQNGIATLTFSDPQNKTGGGSCRVAILSAQIEATAKQFETVKSVRLMPEELFQP
jgi:hypothetical protein